MKARICNFKNEKTCDKPYVSKTVEIIVEWDKYNQLYHNGLLRNDKDSIELVVKEIASTAEFKRCYRAYAILHIGEEYTEYDLKDEELRINKVYDDLRNSDGKKKYKTNLLMSNNFRFCSENVYHDVFNMSPKDFYYKYRKLTEDKIKMQQHKRVHLHIIFYYIYKEDYKFNIFSIYEKLLVNYSDGNGKLIGISNPIIPYGDINVAIRYLLHLDSKYKQKYKISDLICINCNDAAERIIKGAPPEDIGDFHIHIYNICMEQGIRRKTELLKYLKVNDPRLYKFSNTREGRSVIRDVIQDVKNFYYEENQRRNQIMHEEREQKKHNELIETLKAITDSIKDMNKENKDSL